MDTDEILRVLQAEYAYWKSKDRENAAIAIGAMAALSNVIAAIATGRWGETQNEGKYIGVMKVEAKSPEI